MNVISSSSTKNLSGLIGTKTVFKANDLQAVNSSIAKIKEKTKMKARAQVVLLKQDMAKRAAR